MNLGTIIADRFELTSEASSGGMGTVYRARDLVEGGDVALKLLRGEQPIDVERFEREAAALSATVHPGVVRFVAHGAARTGERYIAMEWLEGEDLGARLRRQAISVHDTLRIMRRMAEALAFAHGCGLVHRDVKPSNVFIVRGDVDQVKLVDFGIAHIAHDYPRLTGTGVVLGTPGYIAPEQLDGRGEADARVDVFSMGCVLYECLTGKAAFEGVHVMAVLAKILFQETPRLRDARPDLPEALDALVAWMMAKAPAARPADGAAVAAALDEIGDVDVGPPPSVDRPAPISSERGPSSITRAEQRMVTVVFAGDPDADPSLPARQVSPELTAALEAYGGQLTELPGRSLLVTQWGAGSAVDRAERAAQCALTLCAHLPNVAICVATGRGLISARVVEGEIIDRGVRLLGRSRLGAIRLDDVSAGMLENRILVAREGAGFALRGGRVERGGPPRLLGRPSVFVGRGRELGNLELALSHCIDESLASGVLVLGAAGAGKSRLRREFLEKVRARDGHVEIISGWADSLCPGTPYAIIADAVRRAARIREGDSIEVRRQKLVKRVGSSADERDPANIAPFLGELAGVPFPDDEHPALKPARENAMLMGDAMRAAWEAWLERECAQHPVLLVLEDLHWGDAASVRLIDSTLRNLRERPLMAMVLARPEVTTQFPGLFSERDVLPIKLTPLSRKQGETLVRGALGASVQGALVARILERADGNPFYLEELVRAVAAGRVDALPDSVLGTVEARLDAEGSEAKRVLRAASVFGERFSRAAVTWLLGEVRQNDVSAWLTALAAHELVTPTGSPGDDTSYIFRHTLVREAAYAMLTDADRVLGHRLAGEWLEKQGSPDATALSEHFRRGGEPLRAVPWYLRAAEQALEANELKAALDQVGRGVACGAAGEDLGLLRLVEAEADVWLGALGPAEERASAAARLLPIGSAPWFRAHTQIFTAAGRLGAFDRVEAGVGVVLAAPSQEAPGSRLSCLSVAAFSLICGGRYGAADALMDAIAADAAAGDIDRHTAGLLEQTRGFRALYAGDTPTSVAAFEVALAAFQATGDRRNACNVQVSIGYLRAELGVYGAAEEALRAALSEADRLGLHDVALSALHNLGRVVAYSGSLDEARALELRAAEELERQGDQRLAGVARTYLAIIALLSDDPVTAEREAHAAVRLLEAVPPTRVAAVACLARALLAQGRAAEALPLAREAQEALTSLGMIEEGESLVRLVHAEALHAAGLHEEHGAAVRAARDALLARAAKISDAEWRRRFLTAVPDNARTIALAEAAG